MVCDRCASPQRGKEGGHAVRLDRAQPRISQGRNQIVPPVAWLETAPDYLFEGYPGQV